MENTPQAAKTNWVMIILLIVLIPVLFLGYKYISKKIDGDSAQNNAIINAVANPEFPLIGDWFYKETGVNLKYVNDKYSFTPPQKVNDILKGQVTMAMELMGAVNTLNYEVISTTKLKITDPSNSLPTYELDYNYDPATQTLEIMDQGAKVSYTRNNRNSNHNNSSGNTTNNSTSGNGTYSPDQLKMAAEKLTNKDWKYTLVDQGEKFHYVRRYSNPRNENGQIVLDGYRSLQQEGNYCKRESDYKLIMLTPTQFSYDILKVVCNGAPENKDVGQKGKNFVELTNGGTTLLFRTENQTPAEAEAYTY